VSACKIDAAGVGVFLIQPLGMWALYVMSSISLVWLMCRSPPKRTKHTTQKVYVGHLHHYSKSVPTVWDPKTRLVLPQCHVMFDDNFDTVQAPDPNITQADTMDRLSKTNRYKYDDPFGNEHTFYSLTGESIYTQTT
jgi:hypothetical protein